VSSLALAGIALLAFVVVELVALLVVLPLCRVAGIADELVERMRRELERGPAPGARRPPRAA
jgi:hypothetical protein